jgi:ribosomal protein S18 acetylase RimI-like enzyme
MKEIIRPYCPVHRVQLIALWQQVFGYPDAHNQPGLAIDKKTAVADGLLFIAELDGKVVGSIMAGYDGHRGWIYSLAVLPEYRGAGIGSRLLQHAEGQLTALGAVKINLQIMNSNEKVAAFYRKHGYALEPRFAMGKKILENIPSAADVESRR